MPGTISELAVARDGGLNYIRQYPSGSSLGQRPSLVLPGALQSPEIPVDRLVAYVNDQEAGNWFGSSYLRALYKHFLRKDRLLRVNAINNERNGAGVPIVYASPGATQDQMKEYGALARSYRAGEGSGGAVPHDADLRFRGVEGTLPDILASIRYDDEMMAAASWACSRSSAPRKPAAGRSGRRSSTSSPWRRRRWPSSTRTRPTSTSSKT